MDIFYPFENQIRVGVHKCPTAQTTRKLLGTTGVLIISVSRLRVLQTNVEAYLGGPGGDIG